MYHYSVLNRYIIFIAQLARSVYQKTFDLNNIFKSLSILNIFNIFNIYIVYIYIYLYIYLYILYFYM